jgi:hypothetical protein
MLAVFHYSLIISAAAKNSYGASSYDGNSPASATEGNGLALSKSVNGKPGSAQVQLARVLLDLGQHFESHGQRAPAVLERYWRSFSGAD